MPPGWVTGAKVVLTASQKDPLRDSLDNSGRYLLRSIPPGVYVSACKPGFGKTESARSRCDINENRDCQPDPEGGGCHSTVQVEAAAQTIQANAETGQVVNRRFINDLLLIDPQYRITDLLAPGAHRDGRSCREPCLGTNFVSSGSRVLR